MGIVSLQLVGVYCMHLTLKLALAADPDHCPGQRIKCYSCNSIEDAHCNDPFFRQPQQTKSFPLVDCNDYCFKWAFQGPDASFRGIDFSKIGGVHFYLRYMLMMLLRKIMKASQLNRLD
ncbi:Protein quiver [Schistosoma japonicum]|nr:Protein quiver [Schistosoma japonicum]KAH8870333.1 Protein quiver [Schistosoma japonicum]